MNCSTPGSGHNRAPRNWLEVLRDLIQKLLGWARDALCLAVRLVETPAMNRRVDMQLAEDLRRLELHPYLNDEHRHAVARAAAFARGDVQ